MKKKIEIFLAILVAGLLLSGCVEKSENVVSKKQIEMTIMANNPEENIKSLVVNFDLPVNAKIDSIILPNDIKISGNELSLYEKSGFIKGSKVQAKIEFKKNTGKIGIFWKEKPVKGVLAKIILSGTEKLPEKLSAQGINDKRKEIGLNIIDINGKMVIS